MSDVGEVSCQNRSTSALLQLYLAMGGANASITERAYVTMVSQFGVDAPNSN